MVNQASYVTGNVGHADFDCSSGQTNGPDPQTHAVFLIGKGLHNHPGWDTYVHDAVVRPAPIARGLKPHTSRIQ